MGNHGKVWVSLTPTPLRGVKSGRETQADAIDHLKCEPVDDLATPDGGKPLSPTGKRSRALVPRWGTTGGNMLWDDSIDLLLLKRKAVYQAKHARLSTVDRFATLGDQHVR